VNDVLAPIQTLADAGDTDTVGFVLTVTTVEAVPVQLFCVPVTVYVVVAVGLTVCGFAVPLLHA